EQPPIAVPQRLAATVLEHVAVGDDDAIEVPAEDALEARPRGGTVPDEPRIERRGAEAAVAPDEPHEPARGQRGPRAEVEGEIAEQERPARPVEEDDLVLVGAPAEEDLIHLAAPFRRGLVAEHGDVGEIGPLPLEAG